MSEPEKDINRVGVDCSALLGCIGASAPAGRLTAEKTQRMISEGGYQVTGFVITNHLGGIGIVDKSACRWLTEKEMWWLMHDSAQLGSSLLTASNPAAPSGLRDLWGIAPESECEPNNQGQPHPRIMKTEIEPETERTTSEGVGCSALLDYVASETPITDQCQQASLRFGGAHSGQTLNPLNIYQAARAMERGIVGAIRALKIREEANHGAAKRSPQCADWSNGVAAGNREAIEMLEMIIKTPQSSQVVQQPR